MSAATEIERLVGRDHSDPHSVLGAHPARRGLVFRVLRPGAETVTVLPESAEPLALDRVHPAGVFEGFAPDRESAGRYSLEIVFPDATVVTRDPYSFLPTLGELDLHLAGEGRHEGLADSLGAHPKVVDGAAGVAFAVWAPNARSVSVIGDLNGWDGLVNPMRSLGSSGVWELFVPGAAEGDRYKFELRAQDGRVLVKADPVALAAERPPATASIVHRSRFQWRDAGWLAHRGQADPQRRPMAVYEVHLPSWRRDEEGELLGYEELGDTLGSYARELGFTHVELLPVMQHPFSGSWGYQVTGYFAPDARLGDPDELRGLVDRLHTDHELGVLLDWVPAHFPTDDFALANFDGTALYEHADPRQGMHPDWGTLVFNYGRHEVRNFLEASALHWIRDYHADGLRVDAVASLLYLDYSRQAGEWVPNPYGGRENLEALDFVRRLNEAVHAAEPGVAMVAEESTAWPGVSRPTYLGGLGFGFKWNMGWMHDTLSYFSRDPIHRQHHHEELTFGLVYAFTEHFVLPLSHDEVVHGKGSLLGRMPGDRWQQHANLRALYGYMWAHPGKKLLFMGGELAQEHEWSHDRQLDWDLLRFPEHAGVQHLVRDLNAAYRAEPALWELDATPEGFGWIELNDATHNVLVFARWSGGGERCLVCACNFAPVPRHAYRIGLPLAGRWREALNTDSRFYGGSDVGNQGEIEAEPHPWQGQPASAGITLPPLGVVWLVPEHQG